MKKLADYSKFASRFFIKLAIGVLALILLVYYPIGMIWVHEIDDSPDFSIETYRVENGSEAVATAIALVARETEINHWTPSDPFFYPGYALNRMPAFQRGIIASIARFTIELSDQIARTRGSSSVDEDVQKANGLFNYSPYVWMFDPSTSWLPTTSSATQYKAGKESLIRYQKRLSEGHAIFERRSDNLLEALNRIAADLGSSSAEIDSYVEGKTKTSYGSAGELFYYTKGRLYANYMLLKALEKDFSVVIEERQLKPAWEKMLEEKPNSTVPTAASTRPML